MRSWLSIWIVTFLLWTSRRELLGLLAERLAIRRAIDAAEADAFRVSVVQERQHVSAAVGFSHL
jgi:hypothetical protein